MSFHHICPTYNGHDSWIMMNLYPQRSTDSNGMHQTFNPEIHAENLKHIENIFSSHHTTIWAALGTLIEKRPFLGECLQNIYKLSQKYDCRWISIGKINKKGHPHHPLYLKNNSVIKPFVILGHCDRS